MAIADAISDLFNCGRPRRPQTRDSAHPGEDATRMTNVRVGATLNHGPDEPPRNTSAHDNAATQSGPEGGLLTIAPLDSQVPIDLSTIHASTEPIATRSPEEATEEVPQGRPRRDQVSDQKAKPGKGKQIEQRFLVTTDVPDAGLTAFELDLQNVDSAVLEVTPVIKPSDTTRNSVVETSETRLEDVEKKAPDATQTSPVEMSELQAEEVEKPTAPHEATDTKLQDDQTSIPMAVSVMRPQEIDPSVVASEAQITGPRLPQRASIQFLDLPTGIRGLIYEQMIEENPIRMCRYDDPTLVRSEAVPSKRQFYNLTQVCQQIRKEFLPIYERRTEYIIDLWNQRANLTDTGTLKGIVAIDIDAACFDMQPIDLLPLIRYLARTRKTHCRFASTEGVIFRSIESIVEQLNKLLPSSTGSNNNWLAAVNGPMKRVDLHLFPHEDIRQYYRFRGAEPMLRIVYPAQATEDWMKQSHKVGGEYEAYLEKTGLDGLEMHVVVGHASRRTTNEGRMPLDWRLSYIGSRLSIDQAVRISGTWTR